MSATPGIASEDAAVYGYGVVLATGGPEIAAAARRELDAHRRRRDDAETLWPDTPPAPVGYTPAADAPRSALELAVRIESDCCEGWRAQIAVAEDEQRRRFCIEALGASAVQLARWRALLPAAPLEALPGLPPRQ